MINSDSSSYSESHNSSNSLQCGYIFLSYRIHCYCNSNNYHHLIYHILFSWKARPSYSDLAGFADEPSDAGEIKKDVRTRTGKIRTQYDVEEADTFEPDEAPPKWSIALCLNVYFNKTNQKTDNQRQRQGKVKPENAEATTVSRLRKPKEKMYALPNPRVHHRYRFEGRTERLTVLPSLFETSCLTLTSSFTERPIVSERVNKAWGFNVGYGPLWDLAEDRGWYKEAQAITTGNNTDTEAKRRPRVYPDIRVQDGWEILSLEYVTLSFAKFLSIILNLRRAASPYLPTDDVTTEKGDLKPPPPVSCFFGPFKSQIRQDVKLFPCVCLPTSMILFFFVLTD